MVGFSYNHFGSFTIDIGTVYKQRGYLNANIKLKSILNEFF